LDKALEPMLSTCRGIEVDGMSLSLCSRFRSQRPSLQESEISFYSALVLDNNTVACFQDFQEIEPAPRQYV
jgi:hypothetical protein